MPTPYHIALSAFQKFGPISYRTLCDAFGDVETVWHASSEDIAAAGIKEKLAAEFCAWRNTVRPEQLADNVAEKGIRTVALEDADYPELLKSIHDPPFLLYYRGKLPVGDALSVGVVGSRKATSYGLQVAHDLSRDLAAAGVAVISGLAWGIDEAAHRATLTVNGVTMAVLACGLDANDAARKQKLANEIIAQGGCVLTEFPLGTPPFNHHFPIRNRIIAGIAKGTIVVEAALKSGSLITAYAALRENRDVFAVPGPITSPTSEGTNDLLKRGAQIITKASDVLEALGVAPVDDRLSEPLPALTPTASAIVATLSKIPLHIDEITRKTGLTGPSVASELSLLEIQGVVRHLGGMHYIR